LPPQPSLSRPEFVVPDAWRDTCKKPILIRHGNLTEWSHKAEVNIIHNTADVQLFCEHHLKGIKLAEKRRMMRTNCWRTELTAAESTGEHIKASSGGVGIAAKKHLEVSTLFAGGKFLPEGASPVQNWAVVRLRLKKCHILCGEVYFQDGCGFNGANLVMLTDLAKELKAAGLPFIIAADWNAPPGELQDTGILNWLGAQIVQPADAEYTCRNGHRMLDYIICSDSLASAVRVEIDKEAPWTPHLGLNIWLHCRPRALTHTVIRVPKPLPIDALQKSMEEDAWDAERWNAAAVRAEQDLEGREHGLIGEIPVELLDDPKFNVGSHMSAAVDNGRDFALWSRTMEIYVLESAKVPLKEHAQFLGRGQGLQRRTVPIVHRTFWAQSHSESAAAYWSCVTNNLKELEQQPADAHMRRQAIHEALRHAGEHVADHCREHAADGPPAVPGCEDDGDEEQEAVDDDERIDSDLDVRHWRTALCNIHCCTVAEIRVLAEAAEGTHRNALYRVNKVTDASYKAWLTDSLTKGAGPAHAWSARPTKQSAQVPEAVVSEGGDDCVTDPELVMEKRCCHFDEMWSRNATSTPLLVVKMAHLREELLDDPLLPEEVDAVFSDQAMLQSIHTYKKTAARGADTWAVKEMQALPKEAVAKYAHMIRSMFKTCAWAVQLLLNYFALLGKASGGFRGIGLTPLPYRFASKAESQIVSEWEQKKAGFWDTAIKGCGALRAALSRAFQDEQDVIKGRESGTILWDIAQFFDTIDVSLLMDKAIALDFPKLQLYMSVVMHLAPRLLKYNGAISRIIPVSASIVPGCGKAIAFTRALLYDVLEAAHWAVPRAVPRTYVDDMSQRASGTTVKQVCWDLCAGGLALTDGLQQELGLRLSPKAAVVATNPVIGKHVSEFFKRKGIAVRCCTEARDLGVNNTAGKRRRVGILRDRIGKAKVRAQRIGILVKGDVRARRLVKTGAWAQASWGHQVLGLPPTTVDRIRTSFAKAARPSDVGGCPITAVAVTLGVGMDPLVKSRLELFDSWFDLWEEVVQGGQQGEVRENWRTMQVDLILRTPANQRWKGVAGPMAAVQVAVAEVGWKPAAPDRWIDKAGDVWVLEPGSCRHAFKNAMMNDLSAQLWVRAAAHEDGKGMEDGVDIDATTQLLKSFARRKVPLRGMLEAIVTGATWPADRKHRAMPEDCPDPNCTRCDWRVPETTLHQCWECPANDQIEDKAVAGTQHLKRAAKEGAVTKPSLWLRGLVSIKGTQPVTPMPVSDELRGAGTLNSSSWPAGRYYSDGSGGVHTRYRRLRRCGYGIAHFHHDDVPGSPIRGGAHAVLAHDVQTVPRSELRAATVILERAAGQVVIVVDCKLVKLGFDRGPLNRTKSHLSADWDRFWKAWSSFNGQVEVLWTKAHARIVDIRSGRTTPMDAYGNAAADKFAEAGAIRASVADEDVQAYHCEVKVAKQVQSRRLAILQNILSTREKWRKRPKKKRKFVSDIQLLMGSQHRLRYHRGCMRCHLCFKKCPSRVVQKRAFLRSTCRCYKPPADEPQMVNDCEPNGRW